MERKKIAMPKEVYDAKIKALTDLGTQPEKLKRWNLAFFNAIILKMSPRYKHVGLPLSFDTMYFEEGNAELRKKTMNEPETVEEEIFDSEEEAKAWERIAKLKRAPSGKTNKKGNFRKK